MASLQDLCFEVRWAAARLQQHFGAPCRSDWYRFSEAPAKLNRLLRSLPVLTLHLSAIRSHGEGYAKSNILKERLLPETLIP
jgi:hypothetical protein